MAALMLLLPTEAATEEKTDLVRTDAIPRTTDGHKLCKTVWIHASSHIINTDGEDETNKQTKLTKPKLPPFITMLPE